jgi:hypothetical protein
MGVGIEEIDVLGNKNFLVEVEVGGDGGN